MENFLPVGSVVQLFGGTKKTVIMGIIQINGDDTSKMYDYLGVPYPEGYMGNGSSYLFNKENIETVYFRGYEDEDYQRFMELAKKVYAQKEKVLTEFGKLNG